MTIPGSREKILTLLVVRLSPHPALCEYPHTQSWATSSLCRARTTPPWRSNARQAGAKKSTVVVSAVREWLRMQAHPGVIFVAAITGERRAALSAGPQVWMVAEAWLQHDMG
jgi:hypothetical protein